MIQSWHVNKLADTTLMYNRVEEGKLQGNRERLRQVGGWVWSEGLRTGDISPVDSLLDGSIEKMLWREDRPCPAPP